MARKLPHVVECKSTHVFFEEIAAFDCDRAAQNYATQCRENGGVKNEYRVVKKR